MWANVPRERVGPVGGARLSNNIFTRLVSFIKILKFFLSYTKRTTLGVLQLLLNERQLS